jgi:methionine-rich copper-binding protein CopC
LTRRRFLLLAPAALWPAPAPAHALLVAAAPAAGAVLAAPPSAVVLRFNGRIEKRLSRLRLIAGDGRAHALAPDLDGAPEVLRAAAPPLSPGRWRVHWQVLSVDGHLVSGEYAFDVRR